jgi:predicted transcriptional regulator
MTGAPDYTARVVLALRHDKFLSIDRIVHLSGVSHAEVRRSLRELRSSGEIEARNMQTRRKQSPYLGYRLTAKGKQRPLGELPPGSVRVLETLRTDEWLPYLDARLESRLIPEDFETALRYLINTQAVEATRMKFPGDIRKSAGYRLTATGAAALAAYHQQVQ